MKIQKICFVLTSLACLTFGSLANAADTDSQSHTVTVPETLTIVAPVAQTLTHDETDDAQVFGTQNWEVSANSATGVTVTFSTSTAFVHTTDSGYKRDAKLDLALNTSSGPGTWSVTTATDQTDYAATDESASVVAESDDAGNATFDLVVTFITDEYGVFAAGDYAMTVVGTVVAN